jgi:hypothetical protein
VLNIGSADFNESLDEYIHKRKDKGKLSKMVYSSIKSSKGKDSYLFEDEDSRRDRKPFSMTIFSFFRKKIPSEERIASKEHDRHMEEERAEFEDDDETIQPRTQVVDSDKEDFEDEAENFHAKDKKEGGFMSKLFNFGSKKRQEQEEAESEDMLERQRLSQNVEDLKDTIKVLHKWLEKLPPERISEFKRSPDFEKYKDGLRKLGLIKE